MNQSNTIFSRSKPSFPWLLNPAGRHLCADLEELLALESEASLPSPLPAHPSPANPAKSEGQADVSLLADNSGSVAANGDSVRHPCGTAAQSVLLLVDQRITMLFGSKRHTKAVMAAKAAAFLAWRTLALGKRVGALIFNDRQMVYLGPQCSRLRVRLILYAVLNQNHGLSRCEKPQSNVGMLNQVLRRACALRQSNSLIFLISDGSGYNEETPRVVKDLCRENKCVVALVYDPRQVERSAWKSSATGLTGLEVYSCGCTKPGLETSPPRSRPQIGSGLFACEAPVFHLSTHDNLSVPLLRASADLEDL